MWAGMVPEQIQRPTRALAGLSPCEPLRLTPHPAPSPPMCQLIKNLLMAPNLPRRRGQAPPLAEMLPVTYMYQLKKMHSAKVENYVLFSKQN